MKKSIITLLFSLFLFTLPGFAHAYKVSEVHLVHLQDKNRYVSNPDDILSAETVAGIDAILRKLEADKGIETLVVAVNEIEGGDCFDFALQLGQQNGVGKKGSDNGLVILLVTGERCIQFVTGYGLEGTLPDALCKRIQTRYMNPLFAKGKWDEGMLAGIQAVNRQLQGYQQGQAPKGKPDPAADLRPVLFIMVVFMLFALFAYRQQRRRTRCPKCRKHTLQRSDSRLVSNTGGVRKERVVYTCRNCGYSETRDESHHDHPTSGFGGRRGGGPIIFGTGGFFGGGRGGGGFGGGSFGGGSFGGGGAGSKF